MECNKEEALRAKGIAENRMQGKDFGGARKIALKAQQLFPDLENISQMLAVCEVHCSADIKVNGEIDWYAILQVGSAADEIAIKKQYRKLALLVHPDKNKFAGAEAAFKLVGEAHRTLSDPAKRSTQDMKRGASFKPPRSTRNKQNTSHDEASKQNANDCATSSAKRSWKDIKDSGIDNQASRGGKASKKRKEGKTNNAPSSKSDPCDSNVKTSGDMESVIYPDPEFFDFEKERHPSKFAVDQIWAVYDDMDAMPRFYVQIKEIYYLNFYVRFVWLENDPLSKTETEWSKQDLPVSCGNFRRGKIQITTEIRMFSHVMSWSKGKKRSSYNIYPRKGEIWALFKDWDIGWSKDADNHRVYEYELVEVLSDYTESSGISVANLVKINGFVSLFMRAVDEGPVDVPATEMLRFSHMVPSYRMTGEERVGVPAGSFELDATSLPTNLTESFRCVSIDGSKVAADNLDSD